MLFSLNNNRNIYRYILSRLFYHRQTHISLKYVKKFLICFSLHCLILPFSQSIFGYNLIDMKNATLKDSQ